MASKNVSLTTNLSFEGIICALAQYFSGRGVSLYMITICFGTSGFNAVAILAPSLTTSCTCSSSSLGTISLSRGTRMRTWTWSVLSNRWPSYSSSSESSSTNLTFLRPGFARSGLVLRARFEAGAANFRSLSNMS